jgi:hypothetical protein
VQVSTLKRYMGTISAPCTFRTCSWTKFAPGYAALARCVFLWLAIDPRTKILPVLQLGPRTQNMAHRVIHSLRHHLAPGCLPLFTSDGLNLYFYAACGPFWPMAHRVLSRTHRAPVASSSGADLWPGEEKRASAQAGAGDACDAPWHTGRSRSCLAAVRLLWTAQHRLDFARESHGPPWRSRAGSPHLGHSPTGSTAAGQSGMGARVLSWMSRPVLRAAGEARAAARTSGKRLAQRFGERTPAMAAGRTNRRWTTREVLSSPLPLASA